MTIMNALVPISGRELVVPVTGIAMSASASGLANAGSSAVLPVAKDARETSPDSRDTLRQSEIIEQMRAELSASARTRLQIERDEEAGRFIYRLMDPDTGETVRRWPPERFSDLVNFLSSESGGLVNEKA